MGTSEKKEYPQTVTYEDAIKYFAENRYKAVHVVGGGWQKAAVVENFLRVAKKEVRIYDNSIVQDYLPKIEELAEKGVKCKILLQNFQNLSSSFVDTLRQLSGDHPQQIAIKRVSATAKAAINDLLGKEMRLPLGENGIVLNRPFKKIHLKNAESPFFVTDSSRYIYGVGKTEDSEVGFNKKIVSKRLEKLFDEGFELGGTI